MPAYTQYQQIPANTLRPPHSGAYWTAFVASGHAYNIVHTAPPAAIYSMQCSTPVLHLPSYVINFAQYPVPITRYPIHVASYPIYNDSYPINAMPYAMPYNSGVIMRTPLWRATPVDPEDGSFVDAPGPHPTGMDRQRRLPPASRKPLGECMDHHGQLWMVRCDATTGVSRASLVCKISNLRESLSLQERRGNHRRASPLIPTRAFILPRPRTLR